MGNEREIKLSKWFACLDTNKNFPSRSNIEYEDHGPLRIYNKDETLSIHHFGLQNKNIIIFDGFAYDDDNLMSDHQPLNNTCSVLASKYYEKFGEKFFEKIKGRYLLGVWDNNKQILLLGRDGIGRHPLYYSNFSNSLFFASNLLTLSSSGFIENKPDRLTMSMLILGMWPENESTSFEQIKKLKPGFFIKKQAGNQINKIFYFDPMPQDEEDYISESESVDKFEEVIHNSVEKCLMLKPQGVMLSGGIDSVVVTALANRYLEKYNLQKLVACSGRMLPKDALEYEESMQDKVTQLYNMRHLTSNMKEWIGNRELIECSLEEICNFSYPANYYWAGGFMNFWREISRKNLNRLLTGSGGDELLGLHPAYTADLLRSFNLRRLSNYLNSELAGGKSFKDVFSICILNHGLKLIIGGYWKKLFSDSKTKYNRKKISENIPQWLITDSKIKNDIIDLIYSRRIPETTEGNKIPKDYYKHGLRALNKNGFLDFEAECNYHNTQLAGIMFSSPYQDIDAIKFFLRVKPELFMLGKKYKGLLRSLASKELPGLNLENQKKFYPPFENNYGVRSMHNKTKDLFESSKLSHVDNFGIIDKNNLKKWYNNVDLNFTTNYRLFGMICVENWLSKNL